jgi:hypothetical protein
LDELVGQLRAKYEDLFIIVVTGYQSRQEIGEM